MARCIDCNSFMRLEVLHSNAGWYIGRWCPECGPYSRNSDYFPTKEMAEEALRTKDYSHFDNEHSK